VLDPPEAEDRPFEERALLVTNIANVDPKRLLGPMSHVLAHAYFPSPRARGSKKVRAAVYGVGVDGASGGREIAITQMDNQRGALRAWRSRPIRTTMEIRIRASRCLRRTIRSFYRAKSGLCVSGCCAPLLETSHWLAALRQYVAAEDMFAGIILSMCWKANQADRSLELVLQRLGKPRSRGCRT